MRARFVLTSALLGGLLSISLSLKADDSNSSATLQKALDERFSSTKMSADKQDVVTAGSVLVLHKDGLMLYGLKSPLHPACTYKNNKISPALFGRTLTPAKTLVEGEKVWMTRATVKDDGIFFDVITEPYGDDGRFFGELKVPFSKGHIPANDEILKTVAEVVTVEVSGGNAQGETAQGGNAQAGSAPSANVPNNSQPAQQSFQAIAAPPPLADEAAAQPKTIAEGQTKEQVDAILGQPQKVVNLPNKVIAFYPDLKVTYVNGKVFDVQ